ncbi:hypothetical protein GCM10022214_73050 [Actinomadura miaoliensis]|uniref:Magnesium transporter NIPA n=1 Tax=Actinomadura miaoliensis TaxID=430685 RepID=A0ABP7WWG2_9ACTN
MAEGASGAAMNGTTAALLAVCLYYVGAGLLKSAGARMEPLRGDRPGHLLVQVTRSGRWLTGVVVFAVGVELQLIAFAELPLGLAQPLFSASLVVLLGIAVCCFGERPTPREWLGLAVFAAGTLLIAVSMRLDGGDIGTAPSGVLLCAVTVPSLVLPIALFSWGDRRRPPRHARPLAGVEYGVSCGILVGAVEVTVKGLTLVSIQPGPQVLLTTPYPYLIGVAVILAMAQGTIALQRCRLAVCVSVCTIVAKTYLIVVGSLLYGGDWPADPLFGVPRILGIGLAASALLAFPRYEPAAPRPGRPSPRPPASGPPPAGPDGRSSSSMTSNAVSISGRVPPR